MEKRKVIVLQGCEGVGKDTFVKVASKHLKRKYNLYASHYAFADVLKEMTGDILLVNLFELERYKRDENQRFDILGGRNVREFYKDFSVVIKNFLGKDFFAKIVINEIKDSETSPFDKILFISDLRFEEELETIKTLPVEEYEVYCVYVYNERHLKDNNKFSCDYRIYNDMTSNFNDKVIEIIEEIKNK